MIWLMVGQKSFQGKSHDHAMNVFLTNFYLKYEILSKN